MIPNKMDRRPNGLDHRFVICPHCGASIENTNGICSSCGKSLHKVVRKDLGVKTYMYPMPVLIIGTYDSDGNPNAMNAAWGGICDYDKVSIALSSHNTTDNILLNKDFTVSMGTKDTVVACDYVGLVSLNKEPNKMKKSGLTAAKAKKVNAPVFEELPLAMECRMISYENEVLIGQIINVVCDEKYLGEDGLPDMAKINPILFDPIHHGYHITGEKVADAFSVGKEIK